MKLVLGAVGFLAFLSTLAPAQTSASVTFAAADVHPSPPAANAFFDSGFLTGGRYQLRNATLVNLIAEAWDLDAEAVSGGPPWLDTDRFDIVAKAPPKSTHEERSAMLRALLAERFKLKIHKDEKPLTVYVLSVGKRGAQLQESGGAGTADCKPGKFEEGPPPMINVTCPSMTMAQFARQLHQMAGGYLHNQVVDFTGLKGTYAITVRWSPANTAKTNDAGEDTGKISIFDAVDKELGLNLELTKRSVPVLVVESVERTPTPNDPDVLKNLPTVATEFEAATIKVNKSGAQIRRIQPKPGGRIEVENIPLKDLISLAWNFDFDSDRLVGLPKWGETDAYDIVAKSEILPGEQPPPFDDLRVMLRSLLIERFKMTVHDEEQPIKVWTLTVGKRGAKLKEADPSVRSSCTRGNGEIGTGAAALPALTYTCQNTTMAQLAVAMHQIAPGYVDHPAFDMTGLKGGYDFIITWTPRGAISSGGVRVGQPGQTDAVSDPSGGTTFFDAVEKQLGLHLDGGQKHSMPVLVIDHIEPLGADN
jgi:uncharacterized protein (TIGR03435 family)